MQRETSERGEQPQREGRDRGEGSEMASLPTSELDVLRTLDHQPHQANRSTELRIRRIEEDPYYRERSIAIERAIERARETRISRTYRERIRERARETIWRRQEEDPENREAPLATNISERNPEREREPIANIVQTEMWKSKEVQDALTQLMKETPGSDEWNNKGAELIVEYEEQLEKINEE